MTPTPDKDPELKVDTEHYLQNLLALIHRDGGHSVIENGLEKSTDLAMKKVLNWIHRPPLNLGPTELLKKFTELFEPIEPDQVRLAEARFIVDGQWYFPRFGCDTMQMFLESLGEL